MIRPAPALVWLVGLVWVPLGIAVAVWPAAHPLLWLSLILLAVVCSVDIWYGRSRLAGIEAFTDENGQMAQARTPLMPSSALMVSVKATAPDLEAE